MLKCKNCRTCLKLTRIDFTEISYLYLLCDFCGKVYTNKHGVLKEVSEKSTHPELVRKRRGVKLL